MRLPRWLRSFPLFVACLIGLLGVVTRAAAATPVYLDAQGVIRWQKDNSEVALFGANYSLASSCDFRAAGYVGADRKRLVDADLAHFARMGWNGMRLCFWGDWENCDAQGNLIDNAHLDVLDYTIAEADKRGIAILFTPITTYSSLFPDGKDSDEIKGFSKVYQKDRLGLDPAPIQAQCNYLRQLFNHVNRYTDRAYKDEPAILFVELINEPTHHPDDFAKSVDYINSLASAVRDTGCDRLLFYNLSQDFRIAEAIKTSVVPGMTFAWYPTGLNSGHELRANFLRAVDHYTPMANPALRGRPSLVYEFDSADMSSGYMYPAMARSFREAGAQMTCMFSYDMMATAPYNLGWQTHFLNLVSSPNKAVSAMIAGEVIKRIPRFSHWGDYPENRHFGPFSVSYEDNLSEMLTDDTFLYSNSTRSIPAHPEKLDRVVGRGDSAVVRYPGSGVYFLDKLSEGVWRLELYPDAVEVADPFARKLSTSKPSIQLIARQWPMRVDLPDLGLTFSVQRLDQSASIVSARGGEIEIVPGVYILSKHGAIDLSQLPHAVNGVAMREYFIPKLSTETLDIVNRIPLERLAGSEDTLQIEVASAAPPVAVRLEIRRKGESAFISVPMSATRGYGYTVAPPDLLKNSGVFEYAIYAQGKAAAVRSPDDPTRFHELSISNRSDGVIVFEAQRDHAHLAFTRIGDNIRHGIYKWIPATQTEPAVARIYFPYSKDHDLDDYTAQGIIGDLIRSRADAIPLMDKLVVEARSLTPHAKVIVRLVEVDGTSWSTRIELSSQLRKYTIPLKEFTIDQAVMLPLGYPGRWNYYMPPAKGRGGPGDRIQLPSVERIQFTLRPDLDVEQLTNDPSVDIASATLTGDTAANR